MTPDSAYTSRFILASSSPRRGQLLREAGYEFDVVPPPIAEPDEGIGRLAPARQAEALGYFKARAVADKRPQALVLGADTIVALGDQVLGKADDQQHAREILGVLSGTRHAVTTGLAIVGPDGLRLIASDTTYVTMRAMSDEEIQQYVDSGEWIDKAGAYAIQETADRYVEKVEGSFSNVVGLPIELLARMLRELHQNPQAHKIS